MTSGAPFDSLVPPQIGSGEEHTRQKAKWEEKTCFYVIICTNSAKDTCLHEFYALDTNTTTECDGTATFLRGERGTVSSI